MRKKIKAIVLEEEDSEEVKHSKELCLIGRIWIERSIGKHIFETAMAKVCRLHTKAMFCEVGPNIFTISFMNYANKKMVIEGLPWLFDYLFPP